MDEVNQQQEWTAENVLMMLQNSQRNTPYSDIAEAHNVVLAAEREAYQRDMEEAHRALSRKNEQLAAEREVGHNTAVALGQQIIKLEDQLAAERDNAEKAAARAELAQIKLAAEREARKVLGPTFTDEELGRWADNESDLRKEIDDLRVQLAAEREKK